MWPQDGQGCLFVADDKTLIKQPSSMPTRKIIGAAMASAITTVVVWVSGQLGLPIPGEVAAAMVMIASTIAGYQTRERAS